MCVVIRKTFLFFGRSDNNVIKIDTGNQSTIIAFEKIARMKKTEENFRREIFKKDGFFSPLKDPKGSPIYFSSEIHEMYKIWKLLFRKSITTTKEQERKETIETNKNNRTNNEEEVAKYDNKLKENNNG